jgi:Zn ribbon nucleic-acid-binding protein
MSENRFSDQNKRLTDFQNEVWVHCPQCQKQAMAHFLPELKKVRLFCAHCGFHKEVSMLSQDTNGAIFELRVAAHAYFDAALWFSSPFKGNVFLAYNPEHLAYLEQYISAKLREHKDRSHFTLLEKLPKFYHEAKNRDSLLKLIKKLREK